MDAHVYRLLIWLHVSGNLLWIGSIVTVAFLLMASFGEPKARGELALSLYRTVAVPGFLASFVGGLVRLSQDATFYLRTQHWMHPKLLAAVIVIALHHVIGAKAKRQAASGVQASGAARLGLLLALSAIAATFFAVVRVPA
jgi:putative membrane protein